MLKSCEFCGKQLDSSKQLIVRTIWEKKFKVCKDCQSRLNKHICLRCGRKVPEQILIGGNCESCTDKLLKFRESKENNEMDLQVLTGNSKFGDASIDSKENRPWIQGLFSTNKIQMRQTDDSLSKTDYSSLVEKLIEESEEAELNGRVGFAQRRYGVQESSRDKLIQYGEDLENFLELHSKKLISVKTDDKGNSYYAYSIVFIDEAIDNMTLRERVNISGYESHFFLIENNNFQNISDSEKDKNMTLLKRIADHVNKLNGIQV